jgi:hypothetical protein
VTDLAEERRTWSPREWFRGYLKLHTRGTADLTWFFIQSIPRFGSDPEVQLAVEELVDQLGRILGFEAARDEDAASAVWTSPAGWHLLVWVVDAQSAATRLGKIGHARDAVLASVQVPTEDRVSCLCIVCGPANQRLLTEVLDLRRQSAHVRLIGVDALIRLAETAERRGLSHDEIVSLLRPASPFADAVVSLVASRAPSAASPESVRSAGQLQPAVD